MKKEKIALQSTFKSQDTEEWIDVYFTRPLGLLWAKFFMRLNVHPNVVTILSMVLGAVAGVMFYFPDWQHTVAGILLLTWANLYDSADGQLARMTGKKTLWGRILDGFAGDVWFLFIYVAIALRITPEWGIWIWIIGSVNGFVCHVKQCQMADYYRNVHLYFIKGKEGSEMDSYEKVKEDFRNTPWKSQWFWKLFLFFYCNHTRAQEQLSPQFQRLKKAIKERFGDDIPQRLRDDFRAGSLPLMKYTNILTFNTRAIALYISLFINRPGWYILFELVVLTGILLYMRNRHERLSRQLYLKIDSYEKD